ncbi:MAG: glycerol-3-phosphate 1-O-acyltransferase PlsY [Patescibacteria group bacterium]
MDRLIFRVVMALVGSYLLGGFLGGMFAAEIRGIDLKRRGSGSMGATNVLRTMGPFFALCTLAVDIAKGLGAVALGRLTGYPGLDVACGALAIIGHNWPLSASFKGGKGIATTLGTMILLAPKAPLILVPLWAVLAIPTGYVSLGSVAASAAYPVVIAVMYSGRPGFTYLLAYASLCAVMAIYQHRDNLARLLRGKENNLWRRGAEKP